MADEEDPWGFDEGDSEPQPPPPQPESAKGSAPASVKASTPARSEAGDSIKSGEKPKEEEAQAPPPPPPPEDDGYRKPVQLYRHWVRPKFLQYKYMYNYRTNYYNDVIDYLDKKQVGVNRDIPRAQTWAERVLRTNNTSGRSSSEYTHSHKTDTHLIQTLAASIRPYNYHTKAYINQKYSRVL